VKVGRRRHSHCDFKYPSPWQRSVRRDPHAEWPKSVVFPLCRDGVFCFCFHGSEDRRPCVRLEGTVPRWRSAGRPFGACSGPRLRRGTSLVTTTQMLKAGFVFLSKWSGVVVCCVVSCVFVTSPCSFGLSATSQQYFSLTTNQPSAISHQYFSLRTNQHQPSAASQTNRLKVRGFVLWWCPLRRVMSQLLLSF
jgi:hypothetical protein